MAISLETLIRQTLVGNAGLVALMGTNWYLYQLPQNPPYPCGTIARISTVPITTMDQSQPWQQTGWARIQFDVFCQGPSSGTQTDTIARAIQSAMLGLNAGEPQGSPELVLPAPNFLLNRRMLIDTEPNPPVFRASLDYRIYYQEQ
jgi:hypothetical protein